MVCWLYCFFTLMEKFKLGIDKIFWILTSYKYPECLVMIISTLNNFVGGKLVKFLILRMCIPSLICDEQIYSCTTMCKIMTCSCNTHAASVLGQSTCMSGQTVYSKAPVYTQPPTEYSQETNNYMQPSEHLNLCSWNNYIITTCNQVSIWTCVHGITT